MTLRQELSSWLSPTLITTQLAPLVGSKVPSTPNPAFPDLNGQPTIFTFLRHCGCPFAEKTFLRFRSAAFAHPNIQFIAISHSSQPSTNRWVEAVGGTGPVQVIVDPTRGAYAQWGLGVSSFWHVLNPWGLWNVYKLGKEENIWNRPTESGSRWQTSGSFAVDRKGIVRWGREAPSADWVPDFEEAVQAIEE
ncbi:MAG: hypothetical protein LQ351_006681 [Letrouitia transgressa]|nr:MAG: hypothetical protein LQ351_006681 [Letrouitia transgressa]